MHQSIAEEESVVPNKMIAAGKTVGLLCVAIFAFELGEMSVSFTGSPWEWLVVAGYLVALMRPEHIRSDNGPEFVACNVREWLRRIGVKTLFIAPGSPWENGNCESFNSKLRDELLAGEQFSTLHEAKVLIEQWRRHYNA